MDIAAATFVVHRDRGPAQDTFFGPLEDQTPIMLNIVRIGSHVFGSVTRMIWAPAAGPRGVRSGHTYIVDRDDHPLIGDHNLRIGDFRMIKYNTLIDGEDEEDFLVGSGNIVRVSTMSIIGLANVELQFRVDGSCEVTFVSEMFEGTHRNEEVVSLQLPFAGSAVSSALQAEGPSIPPRNGMMWEDQF